MKHTKTKLSILGINGKILAFSLILSGLTFSQENILLIIADDYGAESLGLHNNPDAAPTPNIDALSASGVRFTDAWSQPSCAPTRATILTGRYGFRTGVGTPGDSISQNEFTMAQGLKSVGYNTACIGKWHLSGNNNGGDDNPNIMGFDHYEGSLAGINDYFNWTKVTNGSTSNEDTYATTDAVNSALSWIGAQGNTPWYCQLAFNAPHTPYHLPPNSLHSFDNLSGTNNDINNNPLNYYHAMIEAMDTEIGRLLSGLGDEVLANTNVIFIGDNGTPRDVNPGLVRDWKGSLYEGGVHVPCIVNGPCVNSPGRIVDATIHTVDLFETVLDMAGTESDSIAPAGIVIDSVSFKGYLTNPNQEGFHRFNFADGFRTPVNRNDGRTISNGDYKLIRFDLNGNEELYQISVDPLESNNLNDANLTNAQQNIFEELQAQLDALIIGQSVDRDGSESTGTPDPGNGDFPIIPARIEAELYDEGGQGVAYNDNEEENIGAAFGPNHRNEGVDLESSFDFDGSPSIGWAYDGEWTQYTINLVPGFYDLVARVASAVGDPGSLRVSINGTVLGEIDVRNTGGWLSWVDASLRNIEVLEGGIAVMRLEFVNGGDFNLNYVEFVESEGTTGGGPLVGTPFGGVAQTIPGRIQAENFDEDGLGIAYVDAEEENFGLTYTGLNYRVSGVDIEPSLDSDSGPSIGWTAGGEWLAYTVDVTAGTYDLNLRVASAMATPGNLRLELDDELLGIVEVNGTGGWSNWQTVGMTDVTLGGGTQLLKATFLGEAGFNLNWLEFTQNGGTTPVSEQQPFGGIPAELSSRIEAENYDLGGQGVAYSDTEEINFGGQYRNDGVDIEPSGDVTADNSVGWFDDGEWLEYTVTSTPGNYRVNLRVASAESIVGDVVVTLGGRELGVFPVESTGSWTNWMTLSLNNIEVTELGEQVLRLEMDGDAVNVNWIEFEQL